MPFSPILSTRSILDLRRLTKLRSLEFADLITLLPVIYVIFRKLNRMEASWLSIPLASIGAGWAVGHRRGDRPG
jgi:hypothetical protein